MRVGNFVILVDETSSCHDWKMARVKQVFKKDGREMEKDRTKVVHLELDEKPSNTHS